MGRACVWLAAALLGLSHTFAGPAAQPALDARVIDRVSAYVERYQRDLAAITATETYRQEERGVSAGLRRRQTPGRTLEQRLPNERVLRSRHLRSHVLVVPAAGATEIWVAFRDVFDVDGRPVRQREDRLKALFLDVSKRPDLRRLADESARYNIGRVRRNFNTPLTALGFMHPHMRDRFRIAKADEACLDDRRLWMLRLQERRRPTLVQTSRGDDVPSEARFCVDPETGEVHETVLVVEQGRPAPTLAIITVTFTPDDRLGLRLPTRMEETYGRPEQIGPYTWGLATYDDFHRFSVETFEEVREVR
jgi:hypothetical protein